MRKRLERLATFEFLTCLLLVVLIGTVINTVAQSGIVLDLDAPEDVAESTAAAAAAPRDTPAAWGRLNPAGPADPAMQP